MKYFIVLPVILLVICGFPQKNADTVTGKPVCPVCKTGKSSVGIVYGLPARETIERARRGELKLGGCMISENSPKYFCRKDSVYY